MTPKEILQIASLQFCRKIKMPVPKIYFFPDHVYMGYARTYHRVIRIARDSMEEVSTHDMVDILQHELLHLKSRKHGHGEAFRKLCEVHGVNAEPKSEVYPYHMDWVHFVRAD